jgi:hypothetical protein
MNLKIIKIYLKIIIMIILIYIGISMGRYGFSMPNSSAADLCFAVTWIAFIGVIFVAYI